MTKQIKTGALLLAEGTQLPTALQSQGNGAGELFMPGWRWVKNLDSNAVDRLITKAGWNFFFLAGGIEMIAYGSDRERATHKALQRILASLKEKDFNCLEITHVTAKRFMGLPYVSVSAHSRHIQQGCVLFAD